MGFLARHVESFVEKPIDSGEERQAAPSETMTRRPRKAILRLRLAIGAEDGLPSPSPA